MYVYNPRKHQTYANDMRTAISLYGVIVKINPCQPKAFPCNDIVLSFMCVHSHHIMAYYYSHPDLEV